MAAIQIVRFRLKDGVNAGSFEAINERFQREVAPTLPGLIRREATRAADGEWLLVLRYTDVEAATKAGRNDHSEVSQALMSSIDMGTLSAGFYEIVSE